MKYIWDCVYNLFLQSVVINNIKPLNQVFLQILKTFIHSQALKGNMVVRICSTVKVSSNYNL